MSERDVPPSFGDEDEPPLPDPRVAWRPALVVAFGVTVLTTLLTVVVIRASGLEVAAAGEEPTGDEAPLLLLSLTILAVHAAILRVGLRRLASYDVGFGWALLGALLSTVLLNLLGPVGLVLSVPVQAAVIRRRSEPRASLVGR